MVLRFQCKAVYHHSSSLEKRSIKHEDVLGRFLNTRFLLNCRRDGWSSTTENRNTHLYCSYVPKYYFRMGQDAERAKRYISYFVSAPTSFLPYLHCSVCVRLRTHSPLSIPVSVCVRERFHVGVLLFHLNSHKPLHYRCHPYTTPTQISKLLTNFSSRIINYGISRATKLYHGPPFPASISRKGKKKDKKVRHHGDIKLPTYRPPGGTRL